MQLQALSASHITWPPEGEVGEALAVAAKGVMDLAGGQQRGEPLPEGFQDAGWDRRHETSA